MTIREAIRDQRAAMKGRPFKEKLSYFWGYYGVATICIIAAIVVLVSFIVNIATNKDSAFCAAFFGVNSSTSAGTYLADFAQAAGIDTDEYGYSVRLYPNIVLDSTLTEEAYYAAQSFAAQIAAKELEIIGANQDLFIHYAYSGYMADLRNIMSQQELEALSDSLYYIDRQLLTAIENAIFGEDPTVESYPDPLDPDSMADPIPVGIAAGIAGEGFRESYQFISDTPVIGVCVNTPHPENALSFLRYIFSLPFPDEG